MEDNRNWSDIGNEIRGAVEDSLRTGDFSRIGGVVADTVNQVVNEAKRQVSQKNVQKPPVFYQTNRNVSRQQPARIYSGFATPRAVFQRKGKVSGVLLTVFGGIGTGIMGVAALVVIILSLAFLKPIAGIGGSIVIALLLFGCIGMITAGVSSRKLPFSLPGEKLYKHC